MAGGKNYKRNDKRNEEETMKFLKDYKEGDRVFDIYPVSYTHLDVYKRQPETHSAGSRRRTVPWLR